MFYALVHGRIDTGGLTFQPTILDIDALNQKALDGELDVTKVSFHAYGLLRNTYNLLSSGAALGRGCGPLVVSLKPASMQDLQGKRIAIPGRFTTAYLLLQLYNPVFSQNIAIMPFHTIMDAVKDRQVDAGLIIHESRFTYAEHGLTLVEDLGQWWEKTSALPIPLGCIAAKKDVVDKPFAQRLGKLIRESIIYAHAHPQETFEYIKGYCQELSNLCIKGHIDLYVNDFSLELGQEGEMAVDALFKLAEKRGIFKS